MKEILNIDNYLIGDDTELEFNFNDFDLVSDKIESNKTYKPKFNKNPIIINYINAVSLANSIKLFEGEQVHCIVSGNFIFGDFIESLIIEKDVVVENMYISTLSLSQNNADSINGLLKSGRIKKLTLLISNYFYSHEKNGIIKYIIDLMPEIDIIVVRNHTKLVLMEISNIRLILSGSSNLRSSNSIEQFVLQESKELYSFYEQFFKSNIKYLLGGIK